MVYCLMARRSPDPDPVPADADLMRQIVTWWKTPTRSGAMMRWVRPTIVGTFLVFRSSEWLGYRDDRTGD